MRKSLLVAFLTALMVCGFALAGSTHFCTVQASTDVSGIPKPSVPEFTLRYIDLSYDVPPTYGIDQYTGETVIIQEGYHVDNRTVEFTIRNQPFTSYVDASGNNIKLYYNFRFKGAYGNAWSYHPDTSHTYGPYSGGPFPDTSASNSDYTVITVNLRELKIPIGVQVEFQVQAIIGYVEVHSTGMLAGAFYGFTGERSDWSNTQTLTIGESQTPTSSPAATPTPTPHQEPQQNEQTEAIIGAAIVAVVLGAALGLLVYLIKRK